MRTFLLLLPRWFGTLGSGGHVGRQECQGHEPPRPSSAANPSSSLKQYILWLSRWRFSDITIWPPDCVTQNFLLCTTKEFSTH